jgi:hypothetical protein
MLNDLDFCALAAVADGQDPIGSAGVSGNSMGSLCFFETALPWPDIDRYPDPAGSPSQKVRAVQREFEAQRGPVPTGSDIPFSFGFAPDPEWSSPSQRRVIIATQPAVPSSRYELMEFLLPLDEDLVVEMARTFFFGPEELPAFAEFLSPEPPRREFFVCTQGSTDICCGMLGIPAYRRMRELNSDARIWRTMHIQGHRFAPTVWEFPSGYEWAFLDEESTRQVLFRTEAAADVSLNMRGWSALPSPLQVLDRHGFIDRGWEWLEFPRLGQILEADAERGRWKVALRFIAPDGQSGRYEAVVKVARLLPDYGCGQTPQARPSRTSPEYVLEELQTQLDD